MRNFSIFLSKSLWLFWVCVITAGTMQALSQQKNVVISDFNIQQEENVLVASATIDFELPHSLEEAMLKGVSLTFVSEIVLTRPRWYWFNKQIVKSTRQTRISYQALTRRWRVLPWSDATSAFGLGVQLSQFFDTLPEALAGAKKIHYWRLGPSAELGAGGYLATLQYTLDISQLSKPLHLGLLGQEEWLLTARSEKKLELIHRGSP